MKRPWCQMEGRVSKVSRWPGRRCLHHDIQNTCPALPVLIQTKPTPAPEDRHFPRSHRRVAHTIEAFIKSAWKVGRMRRAVRFAGIAGRATQVIALITCEGRYGALWGTSSSACQCGLIMGESYTAVGAVSEAPRWVGGWGSWRVSEDLLKASIPH